MPEYRRSLVEGGTFFFTVVTYDRQPILTLAEARILLHAAWTNVCERYPFSTDAVCLLPNHLHCIWSLPQGDRNYSLRWSEIKKQFSKAYRKQLGEGGKRNDSRQKRGEAAVWQRRFWEHTIRDLEDYHRHLDYIHFNPVKHGLVKNVAAWDWSSFHRFVKMGYYAPDWGVSNPEEMRALDVGE
ncbi:MAG: transposase [Anaerolineaceae bacterium]|nr:transposase [Anaerolineaceae bacterium]